MKRFDLFQGDKMLNDTQHRELIELQANALKIANVTIEAQRNLIIRLENKISEITKNLTYEIESLKQEYDALAEDCGIL